MQFLLLDGDPATQRIFRHIAEESEWALRVSGSLREGICFLANHWGEPDIAVMDYWLPDGPATDLFRVLTHPAKRVYIYSAAPIPQEERDRLWKAGVHGVFQKPVQLGRLAKCLGVHEALRRFLRTA
jgi:DNA-binding response OmpR family regulator